MRKYYIQINLRSGVDDKVIGWTETVAVYAENKEQALALLEPQVNKAWVTLKQHLLVGVVENPDEQNGIELK